MNYAPFPLPPMLDASNPVRCRCHKMLTEMMMIYERIIECLQREDIRRPVKSKKKKKKIGVSTNTSKPKSANKVGRPSRYIKDIARP